MAPRTRAGCDSKVPLPRQGDSDTAENEEIDEDDLCAICHQLLYKPVTTRCNHTLCESCMAHWADVSVTMQMTTVGLDDEPMVLLPNDIETRCPMCRTSTTASLNESRELELQTQYPETYKTRELEDREENEDESGASIETLTVYIGNTHRETRVEDPDSHKWHEWNFFVRPSRTDMIEEVHIFLVRVFSFLIHHSLVLFKLNRSKKKWHTVKPDKSQHLSSTIPPES
jgi:hypothetical protein